jgi:very-short-patch-repair endonuclease
MSSDGRIHNRKELVFQRKSVWNNNTSAEGTLWLLIKGKQLDERKFRRQHSLKYYLLDFIVPLKNSQSNGMVNTSQRKDWNMT